jgi:predicted GNAT family N-acyltransferase
MLKIIDSTTVKIRQMAVAESMQRRGIGVILMRYAENFCILNEYFHIELHARKSALHFYQKLNYQLEGEEFEEVGIAHYRMVKQLP